MLIPQLLFLTQPSGADLDQVEKETNDAIDLLSSMGCALNACTLPGEPMNSRLMNSHRMEFGIGIHGEAGTEIQSVLPADDVVDKLMEAITGPPSYYLPLDVRSSYPISVSSFSSPQLTTTISLTKKPVVICYINESVLFSSFLTILLTTVRPMSGWSYLLTGEYACNLTGRPLPWYFF